MFKAAKILKRKKNKIGLPHWINSKIRYGELHNTKKILRKYGVYTVCEKARCPNIGYCFSKPAVTFMILGSKCTRSCGFCGVETAKPGPIDIYEPEAIAKVSKEMDLKYVLITSVTRDDLLDGGASQFANTIRTIKNSITNSKVEVLTPDFQGKINNLKMLLDAGVDVFSHNVEVVPRLYPHVRPLADYICSLRILEYAKKYIPKVYTKSGLMMGLGEKVHEVMMVLEDLRDAGCDIITIGQYLRPSKSKLPVVDYIRPEVFDEIKREALSMGFKYVASGPLVRSSLNAEEIYNIENNGVTTCLNLTG